MFPTFLYEDDVQAAQDALRDGLDPDKDLYEVWRALHFNGISARMVQLFVDWGADINASDYGSSLGHVRMPLDWTPCAVQCILEGGAEPVYYGNVYIEYEKRCEIDAFKARRDAVMRLLLSIPGLHRGLALRVGRWVLQTH